MTFTQGFILVAVSLIFIVDLALLVKKGYASTVSWTLYRLGVEYPVVPFLMGVVMGHLWWSNQIPCAK